MEVSNRDEKTSAKPNPFLQQLLQPLSPFCTCMDFAFQTRSKNYVILQYNGDKTLATVFQQNGCMDEHSVKFYASEIINALEILHSNRITYSKLSLDNICLREDGHIALVRTFCGETYWAPDECVCSLEGQIQGDVCGNQFHRGFSSTSQTSKDWMALGNVLCQLLSGVDISRTSKRR